MSLHNQSTTISRKLPRDLENPIDNYLIDLCEYFNPFFKKLKFTPNTLTTLSLFTGLFSLIFYLDNSYIISAIFLFISYWFDCTDGNFARTYNMVSKFGDYYDHVKDIFIYFSIFGLFLFDTNVNLIIKYFYFIVIVFLFILMSIHMSCQEDYYKYQNQPISETLDYMKSFHNNIDASYLKYTRYFGCGTFYSITSLLIFLLSFL